MTHLRSYRFLAEVTFNNNDTRTTPLVSLLRPVGCTCKNWSIQVYIWNINIKCKTYYAVTQKKLSKERAGIATVWPLLNKILILMLHVPVWILRECYIWTKNHVQRMSQIKTIIIIIIIIIILNIFRTLFYCFYC